MVELNSMAFEARFKVGQSVLALEPITPRYFGGIIKRVFDVAREAGGPTYEVQFFADGDNFPLRSFIVPEAYIFEAARLLTYNAYTTVDSVTHQAEYAVEDISGHRVHQHGRFPCPYLKREARHCKAELDYRVVWVGYDLPTWELEISFVVSWLLLQA